MSKLHKIARTGPFLLALAVISLSMVATSAAAITVTRDLPDAVSPGEKFNVSLTQSGFVLNAGYVTETLPVGFRYVLGSLPSDASQYDEATNNLTVSFRGETTLTYLVTAGTAEQIEHAVFSGTWKAAPDIYAEILTGEVAGETELTVGVSPTPTPTPTSTPSNGGGGGGGGGGGATPTPTSSTTPTASTSPSPSGSPGPTATPTTTGTPVPSGSPTSAPTAKPGIPGFELILALAGLCVVAQWLWRGRR